MFKDNAEKKASFYDYYSRRRKEIESMITSYPLLKEKPLRLANIGVFLILFFLILPLMFLGTLEKMPFNESIFRIISIYIPFVNLFLIFSINQRLLVPRFFSKKKIFKYILNNLILLFLSAVIQHFALSFADLLLANEGENFYHSFNKMSFSEFLISLLIFIFLNFCSCGINLGIYCLGIQFQYFILSYMRQDAIMQAKVAFLKRQISSHFLFNTMNNIIALMDIDVPRAKKSMFSLSSILRSILYESKKDFIPLKRELEIIENYSELEKLHFGEKLKFELKTDIQNPTTKILSLLLLPLVENLFKHCRNLNGESFVRISITERDGVLIYESENSNYPKENSDNEAHGIGLTNLQQRLDMQYNGNYDYRHHIEGNTYKVYLKIKLK